MEFIGRFGNDVLFSSNDFGVIVNEKQNSVVETGELESLLASASWDLGGSKPSEISIELADAAMTDLDIHVFADNDRMYTIPKAVQAEAKRALEWRKEHHRGGTSVGLNTARTLARGGQIGIKKLRHIAKYFPRHEVDKKGKGYKPGEDGYPSNGRIAWALWGGDAAQRWASAIVEREDKKSASTYETYEPLAPVNLSEFSVSIGKEEKEPEFFIRLYADGSGFDRLYKRDVFGVLSVWDNGEWSDLGESFSKYEDIDKELDIEVNRRQKFYAPVDAEASIVASAFLDSRPFDSVFVSELDYEEAALMADSIDSIDWLEIDAVLAAGTDNKFTPEERAAAVEGQPRDAQGQFAKKGGRVKVHSAGGQSGVIQSIQGNDATVKLDSGEIIQTPVKQTEAEKASEIGAPVREQFYGEPLDVTGILGQPRRAMDPSIARLEGTLPPLTKDDITALLSDWPKWVADQRASYKEQKVPQVNITKPKLAPNAYNDPYLRSWLDKKSSGKGGKSYYPNRFWYQPSRPDQLEKKKSAKSLSSYAVIAAGDASDLTPQSSDVPPVYMAVVAPDDPQAVMDLICLIPANSTSTTPAVFTYKKDKWEKDDRMLTDLKSPTPPPVIVLDDESLASVIEQISRDEEQNQPQGKEAETTNEQPAPQQMSVLSEVDKYIASFWSSEFGILPISAAGGLDRNRGNAERLRHYWTVGRGGLKIRWGTGGDWTRCVRHLSKYLGPRAKGYCALRHKEMTGLWTGDKAHRQMYGRKGKGVFAMSDEMVLSQEEVIEKSLLIARREEIKNRVITASGGYQAPAEQGSKFRIPLVVPEGIETGDGRKFSADSITMRELPLPLMWQIKTDEGHYGSVVVGRIDKMERIENGIGNAEGVFDNGEYGKEAERLVRGGFIRGISADLDKFEADEDKSENSNEGPKGQNKILISKARVMGVTLVPKPAFQECTIELVKESDEMDSDKNDALVACAAIAASIPVVPPRSWFGDPKLAGPTPLTVTDDGKVFGHIAAWHVDHIGLAFGTKPPRSKSNYSYFHTGVVRTDDGTDVPVGQLTLAGGHASLSADARAAAKHYDDTGSAFADVHAGEDAYGIWVSGALRPSVTPEQVRAIRASAPSGDWRPIGGALELVAVCQVNVPGFPIARARVASGQMYALVAAGASYLARLKEEPENIALAAEDVKARFATLKAEIKPLVSDGGCGCCPSCTADCNGLCCPNCRAAKPPTETFYIEPMKKLLSDIVGFYFRAHGAHWNVVGEDFAQYHELFGEIYEDVYGSIDPLAENIRKSKAFPPASLKDFADMSSLADSMLEGGSPKALAADLLMANEALIEELKEFFTMVEAADEQGIANFIAERIDMHQKWSWQLASSLTSDDLILVENQTPSANFEAVFSSLAAEGVLSEMGEDFAYISEGVRQKAAEKGQALPDGSFPIRNIKDLKNAVHAYGRAKASKKAKVRAHIIKRAKALGREDLIPETFKSASIEAEELSALKSELATRVHGNQIWADKAAELSARIKSMTAAGEQQVIDVPLVDEAEKSGDVGPKFTAKTQPRDAQGRFRDVLARLKQDLGVASLHSVAEQIKEVENLDNTGNYAAAAKGARDVIDVVNRIDTKALDPTALGSVRMGASALAQAISNLPLPFQDQAQKIRYSDVPPALRDLMDDMINKVEAKIGADDAKIATEKLKSFQTGSELFNQSEISSEMNKLLRLLT